MIAVFLSDPYLHWDWSIDIPPTEKIAIQPRPNVATVVDGSSGTVDHVDVAVSGFLALGMGRLTPGDTVDSVQGLTEVNTITCRLDSDDQLTIAVSGVESDNMTVPHEEPRLSEALSRTGSVLLLITSDSLNDKRAIDLRRLLQDVANGGVLGAFIPVVDERP